jgi:hypothetical protein
MQQQQQAGVQGGVSVLHQGRRDSTPVVRPGQRSARGLPVVLSRGHARTVPCA